MSWFLANSVWWITHNRLHLQLDHPQSLSDDVQTTDCHQVVYVMFITKNNEHKLSRDLSNANDNGGCTFTSLNTIMTH